MVYIIFRLADVDEDQLINIYEKTNKQYSLHFNRSLIYFLINLI